MERGGHEKNSPGPWRATISLWHGTFLSKECMASGNIGRYFDIIYQQVALFQEQVLSNFVEKVSDVLSALKDEFALKCAYPMFVDSPSHCSSTFSLSLARPYGQYMIEASLISSVAPVMKSLYEAIKSRSLAHLTIHNIPLELQLSPHLDSVLHSTDDEDFAENDEADSQGGLGTWGRGFTVAKRLPALEPWKSLLLLDGPDNPGRQWMDVYAAIRGTNVILFSPYCNSRSRNHSGPHIVPLFMPVPNLQKLIIMATDPRRSTILECRELIFILASRDSLIRLLSIGLSLTPQLEIQNRSHSPVPNGDVEKQPLLI
jgi:hypothetical protein